VASALVYLVVCSARNAMRTWFERLRQPRYSAGVLAGTLYFYWFVLRPRRPGSSAGPLGSLTALLTGPYHGLANVILGSLLLIVYVGAWVWPGSGRNVLKFSRADVDFLFAAPIPRRQLVQYRVWRLCVRPAFSCALLTLMLRPAGFVRGTIFFAGLVIVFETVNLYLIGVTLRRQSASAHRASVLARERVPIGMAVVAMGTIVVTLAAAWPNLAGLSFSDLVVELGRLGGTGLASLVLAPFATLAQLPLAVEPLEFVRRLPVPLLLLGAAYAWTVRADASLEEMSGTSTRAERPTASSLAAPPVPMRSPFTLAPLGRSEMALLWKNLISFSRHARPAFVLRLLPIVVVLGLALSRTGGGSMARTLGTLCLVFGGYVVLLGPQMMTHDLRRDLAHLSLLKTWPLPGAVVVRGEVMAPAIVLSAGAWILIGAALSMSSSMPFSATVPLFDRISFAVGAMLIAPGLILVQVVLQNAIAMIFPAWVGVARTRGIDVMGQRLLMMAGVTLVLAVACVPAAIAAGLVGFAIRAGFGFVPIVIPAGVGLVILLLQCGVAVEALGNLFERTDISAVNP
jgi:ABC-2 type transport system permease protein